MKPLAKGRDPALALALAAAAGVLGCGANLQAVYEGDVRFEHCMALDLEPRTHEPIRRRCWSEWLDHYTYGQTRDRIVHAEERLEALGGR